MTPQASRPPELLSENGLDYRGGTGSEPKCDDNESRDHGGNARHKIHEDKEQRYQQPPKPYAFRVQAKSRRLLIKHFSDAAVSV
jgi:hypothetical protein